MAKIYDFKALNNKGAEVDFAQFEGKVLMIVNTASKCGFTPQYDGLEALYQQYKEKGLVILGFPCDQFAHQEPGSNEEIAEFCRLNHKGIHTHCCVGSHCVFSFRFSEPIISLVFLIVQYPIGIVGNRFNL